MVSKFSERLQALFHTNKLPRWIWVIIMIIFAIFAAFGFLINSNDTNSAPSNMPGSNLISTTRLFFDITLKLGVVILLIYIFMQLLKRWQGVKQGNQKKCLSVVETAFLNPRQSLHLVKAGDKLLLIGSTDQTITCLTELNSDILIQTIPAEADDAFAHNANPVQNFASLLSQSLNKH
ncbi:MAG: flagellar biosynthetic protein FliO [Chloroflexi bacterium]|nr:flagellar biosynthetic protein FliO [Chloroflexota bacterium]